MVITLERLAKFFLYTAVLSVVIVMSSTFFPFIGGKYYFFRFMVELALMCTILWWAFEAPEGALEARLERVFSQPIFLAVSAFVLAVLLASIFAYNPHAGFWSNYERGEGGFQMLHYYAFFVLLLVLFEHEKDWRRLFGWSLVAALLMIAYGVLAAGFVDNFIGQYRDGSGEPLAPTLLGRLFTPLSRFQGSLGNPAYVDPYLLFAMFYALWRWISGKKTLIRNIIYVSLLALLSVFFILGQTRGAFLGLLVAIGVFFAYIIVVHRPWRKIGLLSLAVLVVLGGILYQYRFSPAIQALPGGRLLTINFTEATAQTRFWTWGSAWQGFLERPIFGWGPENFSTVFDKHFDTRHYVPGQNTETWFDRAHSVIFDYLAETGLLGLLGFVSIWVAFYWQFFKMRARRVADAIADQKSRIVRPIEEHLPLLDALVFAMPFAYLVQGLILFDVLPIYMNVFLFLAFASALFTRRMQSA